MFNVGDIVRLNRGQYAGELATVNNTNYGPGGLLIVFKSHTQGYTHEGVRNSWHVNTGDISLVEEATTDVSKVALEYHNIMAAKDLLGLE